MSDAPLPPTVTADPRSWLAALREALARPLASYYLILGSGTMLILLGVLMVASASSVYGDVVLGDPYGVVKRQLIWLAVGVPLAFLACRFPLIWVRRLTWLALPIVAVLIALTKVPGLGVERNGQVLWLGFGPNSPLLLQPSEIAKLVLVLWAAHVFASKERLLSDLRHILVPVVVPGMMLIVGLVLWQKDLGTALVMVTIVVAMVWVVGLPLRVFAIALLAMGVGLLYLATTEQHRIARLLTFTDPFADYHVTGWQPVHGLFALASGGWLGQGIGGSQQKWGTLPEAHTDYIFAVLGEELGLMGTLLVIVLFLSLAYAATRIALHTDDPFVRYASFGIVAWLLGQMMINVGMVLGLLPVIGIPLPLVSYGGSSLLPALIALGLLVGFARREPEAARALAARRRPTGTAASTVRQSAGAGR